MHHGGSEHSVGKAVDHNERNHISHFGVVEDYFLHLGVGFAELNLGLEFGPILNDENAKYCSKCTQPDQQGHEYLWTK